MAFSAEEARESAELAVKTTREITGVELDYSAASLQFVENLICGFREEGHTAESMNDTIFLFGCYVGEVIIRSYGGQWKRASETSFSKQLTEELLVVETPNKAAWNPIGKAFKLLENGMEDSLTFFYGVVSHSDQVISKSRSRTS